MSLRALGLLALLTLFTATGLVEPGKPAAKRSHEKSRKGEAPSESWPALRFKMKDIDGKKQDLMQYQGKVVLMVNVASKCGLTPQYEGLEKLYREHKDKGLVVLGFPANEFGGQEPGTNAQIKEFCTKNFSVSFPMFSKVCVKGPKTCRLYRYLTGTDKGHSFGGDIRWNFTKFLIDHRGQVIARFEPGVKPDDPKLHKAVAAALKQAARAEAKQSAHTRAGLKKKD